MKKLMLAMMVVATAVVANAAATNWTWKTAKTGGAVYAPGGESTLASGTAYLFVSTAAQTVFDSWKAGTAVASVAGSLDNSAVSAGKIAGKSSEPISYEADPLVAVFAVETTVGSDKYLYISATASAAAVDVGSATLSFAETTASQAATMLASEGYKGAGWYKADGGTAPLPEPTSGLLLLFGVAGLALRRKQK